jgi:hypothetical protein
MAKFFADAIKLGTTQRPRFEVAITLGNYGSSLKGPPKAVARCSTIEELDEQVDALIESLNRARNTAKTILKRNERQR